MNTKIVIIGAGPAGVSLVETLRAEDQQSELVMLTTEPYPPYSPPAMADHFIKGTQSHFWRGADWPERMAVDYRTGARVERIEPGTKRLWLQDGSSLDYDTLVIATGSRLHAPLAGAQLPGVYNFKSLSAAEELVAHVRTGEARQAVIVGAGFIGVEIALLLSELGVAVTQVEMMPQVMPAMLDPDSAVYALDAMRQRRIDVRLNTRALRFTGEQRATGVELESGELLQAPILVAATGVRPNIDLLAGSGVAYKWGITVDAHMRTSQPAVYAAGDVVEVPDRLTGETYVHAIFPNAVAQGRVVGLNILGYDVAYEGGERMNSLKHLGLPMMAVGLKEGDEVLQARHDGGLRTIYLQDGRIVGFQLVGDIRAAGVLRALMLRRAPLDGLKKRLLEPQFGQGMVVGEALAAF